MMDWMDKVEECVITYHQVSSINIDPIHKWMLAEGVGYLTYCFAYEK